MLLAEAMVPLLNVLEIALRNALHRRLRARYGRDDWWRVWPTIGPFAKLNEAISEAERKLARRRKSATPDKIVAELTFGFWTSLFNSAYQCELWKDLRLAFPNCPKEKRKRHTVSAALNQVRDLRNRVFHHEPLLWLVPDLPAQHGTGLAVINWVDPNLMTWLAAHDRLPNLWMVPGR